MHKWLAAICMVLGVILLVATHFDILEGAISGRGIKTIRGQVSDDQFWFHAGINYGLALIITIASCIYFFTGYKYLPKVTRGFNLENLVYGIILAAITLGSAKISQGLLPLIYN